MKLMPTAAALAALILAGQAGAATTTLNAGPYSVTYDPTTPGFGTISSWSSSASGVSFEWSLSTGVNLTTFAGASQTATFVIPDFTITANPGYVLGGALVASLGNITYSQSGGATTSITASGNVSVDGGTVVPVPAQSLAATVSTPYSGYFSGTASFPVTSFHSLSITGGLLTLSASGASFVSIGAQPQNKLNFEFTAAPVPEPESLALMLAGLGVVGLLARRRLSI